MAQLKAKRYIFTFDADGEEVVWIQHADGSARCTGLFTVDCEGGNTPILDLRNP